MVTDDMWKKLFNHNKNFFSNLNRLSDTDPYYSGIKKALFYTISFLVLDDVKCTDECMYWFKLIKLTKEYSSECVEKSFESLVNNSENDQAKRYYKDFSIIKGGYSDFFQVLNNDVKSYVLDKYGFEIYAEMYRRHL